MNLKAVIISCLVFIASCSSDSMVGVDCYSKDNVTPYCKFRNPEDVVVLPNGQLIVSQMGNLEEKSPNTLVLFDLDDNKVSTLFGKGYPAHDSGREKGDTSWGNLDCAGSPQEFLSPHGISLLRRADDRLQLMVVNHGHRESVEFFEVIIDENNVSTIWRGCVLAPDKEFLNDVVALADGGFIVSNMYRTDGVKIFGLHLGVLKALFGMDSGYLLEWHPWQQATIVPGSQGPLPNGLALSQDGRFIFQNLYASDEVRKLDRRSGEVVTSISVAKPDNTTVDENGYLLVASQKDSMLELKSCIERPGETCLLPFEIVRIDPETMQSKVVFKQEGPPMGAGTVAVQLQDRLLIGSFLGDRMIVTHYSGK